MTQTSRVIGFCTEEITRRGKPMRSTALWKLLPHNLLIRPEKRSHFDTILSIAVRSKPPKLKRVGLGLYDLPMSSLPAYVKPPRRISFNDTLVGEGCDYILYGNSNSRSAIRCGSHAERTFKGHNYCRAHFAQKLDDLHVKEVDAFNRKTKRHESQNSQRCPSCLGIGGHYGNCVTRFWQEVG